MGYIIEQRWCFMQLCFKYESVRKYCRKFWSKFPGEPVWSRWNLHYLVNKLNTIGSLLDNIPDRRWTMLTEEALDDTGVGLETSWRKSHKWLVRVTGISRTCAQMATQLLKLWPYKTAVVECDQVTRILLCNWFLWSIHDGEVDPQLVLFQMRFRFPYRQRWNVQTIGIGVWKIKDLKMAVLWVAASCSLVEVNHCFRVTQIVLIEAIFTVFFMLQYLVFSMWYVQDT